jgi:hypothetical protein
LTTHQHVVKIQHMNKLTLKALMLWLSVAPLAYFFIFVKYDSSTVANAVSSAYTESVFGAALIGLIAGIFVIVISKCVKYYLVSLHRVLGDPALHSSIEIINAATFKYSKRQLLILTFLGGGISFLGALGVVGVLQTMLQWLAPAPIVGHGANALYFFVLLVVVSPITETLIVVLFLEFLRKRFENTHAIALLVAIVCGALHATLDLKMFFETTWIFWVLNDLYLNIRRWNKWWPASLAVLGAHFINNFLAFQLALIRQ